MGGIRLMSDAWENYSQAASEVIRNCEAFIQMDINQKPVEAIFVKVVEPKQDQLYFDLD